MATSPIHNEQDVLLRLADGDKSAFKNIYDLYYLSVFRFAKKYVPDIAAAEDITTESFLKLWQRKADFDHSLKLKSFLFIATKNACLNYLRNEKRSSLNKQNFEIALKNESEKNFPIHEITEEIYAYLYDEIEKLPTKMKSILQLHLKGLKNEEIAAEMNIAEKTIRNLKVEAIKILKVAMLKRGLVAWMAVVWLLMGKRE